MNPKRILLILAGLLAFAVGLVTALHAQDSSPRFEVAKPGCHVFQSSKPSRIGLFDALAG
jgi:hypothetical protein